MLARIMLLGFCLLGLSPASAEEMGPQQSISFVEGKSFAYTCFNGVTGEGRIFQDGSVMGDFQLPHGGQKLFATLPPATIRVDDGSVCAHIAGLFIRPCFKVERIDGKTFRGSIAGLDFAYCVFRQVSPVTHFKSSFRETAPERAVVLRSLNPSTLY